MSTPSLLDALSGLASGLRFDPGYLVGLHRQLPLWGAGALAGAGLLAALFGSGKVAFRLVLAPLAAAAGFFAGKALGPSLGLAAPTAAYALGGGLAALALAMPAGLLFLLAGVPGGLLGGELAGADDYWVGFIPGFAIAGVIAFAAARFLSVLVSAVAGSAALVLGGVSLLAHTRFGGPLLAYPVVPLALAGCVAVVAMVYQLKYRPTEEELAKAREEKARRKQLAVEEKARAKRFEAYAKKASK